MLVSDVHSSSAVDNVPVCLLDFILGCLWFYAKRIVEFGFGYHAGWWERRIQGMCSRKVWR